LGLLAFMELLQEPSTHVRPFVYMSFTRHDLRQIYVTFIGQTDASLTPCTGVKEPSVVERSI